MGMFFNKDISTLFVGGTEVSAVYLGSEQVWPVGLPVGTVFNFEYTGTVQEVELPAGKYKLQCWGAQGGNVTGAYAINGSKGGYSEGVLTLTKTTKLYVFVGGQGTSYTSSASQTSTSVVNGGWNGGGAGVRTARYSSGGTDGRSFPRGGGGATDISTVTSTLSYSSGRTTRDSASLLARCIVAGGGAGASARYTVTTETTTENELVGTYTGTTGTSISSYDKVSYYKVVARIPCTANTVYSATVLQGNSYVFEVYDSNDSTWKQSGSLNSQITTKYDGTLRLIVLDDSSNVTVSASLYIKTTTTSNSTSSSKSSGAQQGGGTSGKGQYPGKATSAGSGGIFGLGISQTSTSYRYCGGGGGGGWYGGGTDQSDSSTSYINYSGGGSGFVNISANSSSRPSGYTGLQLDSGTTTAGNTSHPSTSGGTETGHSGNGYARITVIE